MPEVIPEEEERPTKEKDNRARMTEDESLVEESKPGDPLFSGAGQNLFPGLDPEYDRGIENWTKKLAVAIPLP